MARFCCRAGAARQEGKDEEDDEEERRRVVDEARTRCRGNWARRGRRRKRWDAEDEICIAGEMGLLGKKRNVFEGGRRRGRVEVCSKEGWRNSSVQAPGGGAAEVRKRHRKAAVAESGRGTPGTGMSPYRHIAIFSPSLLPMQIRETPRRLPVCCIQLQPCFLPRQSPIRTGALHAARATAPSLSESSPHPLHWCLHRSRKGSPLPWGLPVQH